MKKRYVLNLNYVAFAFEQQKIVGINYKGHLIGDMRADIVVDNQLIIELKAVERLMGVHQAQLMTYLKVMELPLGLLINFNVPVLKNGIKRVVL
ncbi:MAG: GxxExxY protein [Chloroflexota bacterium]